MRRYTVQLRAGQDLSDFRAGRKVVIPGVYHGWEQVSVTLQSVTPSQVHPWLADAIGVDQRGVTVLIRLWKAVSR